MHSKRNYYINALQIFCHKFIVNDFTTEIFCNVILLYKCITNSVMKNDISIFMIQILSTW